MKNETKAKEVEKILVELSKLDKSKIPTKNGSIIFPEFYKIKEVKEVREKLRQLEVDSKWLFKHGFLPAGMLLRI